MAIGQFHVCADEKAHNVAYLVQQRCPRKKTCSFFHLHDPSFVQGIAFLSLFSPPPSVFPHLHVPPFCPTCARRDPPFFSRCSSADRLPLRHHFFNAPLLPSPLPKSTVTERRRSLAQNLRRGGRKRNRWRDGRGGEKIPGSGVGYRGYNRNGGGGGGGGPLLLARCVCSVRAAGHRATTTVEKKRRIRGWREKRKKEDVIGCRRERPGASLSWTTRFVGSSPQYVARLGEPCC